MKKFISTMASILMAAFVMAQVPDLMNYQAVARNTAGQALANQSIRVRLSVVKNAVAQYSETRQVTTNALGLFNVQIGRPGALSITGNFGLINWQNNAAPGYGLKVELDINNSGNFIDMGSQALVTVPYAFASNKSEVATETLNIAGRPLDFSTPALPGSVLTWNGANWVPVKKDTVLSVDMTLGGVAAGGPNAAWVFPGTSAPVPTITVTSNEMITANFTTVIYNELQSNLRVSYAVCFQNVNGGAVTPFNMNQPVVTILPSETMSLASSAAKKLAAGTYRILLGIRNVSANTSLNSAGPVNGFIEIKR